LAIINAAATPFKLSRRDGQKSIQDARRTAAQAGSSQAADGDEAMLRRILRWILRAAATVLVLFIIAIVVDYFTHRVPSNAVLEIKLTGTLVERGNTNWLGALRGTDQTALNNVRSAIHNAERDQRIVGLSLKVIDPEMEMAQAQEIADAVAGFAKKGKWTAAYIETAGEFALGNLAYMVASPAGEVSMMPQGELNLVGIGMQEIFLRGALDWVGVRPDLYAIGKYKTAANMFLDKQMNDAQREADEGLIKSLYGQLTARIAAQRHLEQSAVIALINQAPFTAADGLRNRLIDKLEYEDQFDDRIKNRDGTKHETVDYLSYVRPRFLSGLHAAGGRIAVVYGSGEIDRGKGGYDPLLSPGGSSMGSDTMSDAFEQVRDDDSIKAVIFRIDSPGGSVVASELIRREVELTAKKKPLVVSMSGYAASGGYWVSTPAIKIIADPGTVTGSIGVLGGKFNVAPALAKLGVNTDSVSEGDNVTMFDSFTDFTPAQTAMLRDRMLGDVYKQFVQRVAQSRHLSVDQVEKIAQGRVWTGEQALTFKLVDQLGDFDAALKEAKTQAKLPLDKPVELVSLPRQPSLVEQVLGAGAVDSRAALGGALSGVLAPWLRLLREERIQSGAAGALYCAHLPFVQ
jgi:protease-4